MPKDAQDGKAMLTTADIADEVGFSDQTIRNWIIEGVRGRKLRASRFGSRYRIKREDWEEFKHYMQGDQQPDDGRSSDPFAPDETI